MYVPKVEEVIKPEYDSDDEDEKKKVVEEDPADLDDEYRYSRHCLQNIYFCYQPSTPNCHCW